MTLSIRIISSPPGETVSEWNTFFPEEGGSIGRGFSVNLRLNDAKREISSLHAIISKTSRGYQVTDNSTNGLFINGVVKSLGKGNSTTLNDGDILGIGGYRLLTSCFLPMQVRVQPVIDGQTQSLFADDPFHPQEPKSIITRHALISPAAHANVDLVESDPFNNNESQQQAVVRDIVLNFSALDDAPWTQSELKGRFSTSLPVNDIALHPQVIDEKNKYTLDQQLIDNALDLALGRLLDDISPHSVEKILNNFSATRFWQLKPDYWKMYKRYFNRQIVTHDWKMKFKAYFQAALKLQHGRRGENL
jgi:predicted component of type VI protein secretion system